MANSGAGLFVATRGWHGSESSLHSQPVHPTPVKPNTHKPSSLKMLLKVKVSRRCHLRVAAVTDDQLRS